MRKLICYILIIFSIAKCRTKTDYNEINYKDLPIDVRDKFIERYNYKEDPKIGMDGELDYYSPSFAECYDLNLKCNCSIKTETNILGTPNFVIESCKKNIKIPWTVYQRVFVIKDDLIYYPWANRGSVSTGEARSYNIKIDTLKFRIEKMR